MCIDEYSKMREEKKRVVEEKGYVESNKRDKEVSG